MSSFGAAPYCPGAVRALESTWTDVPRAERSSSLPMCPAEPSAPRSLLRVLLVEDCEDDALLIVQELKRAGYGVTSRRVDSAAALRAALVDSWDLVTCDWKMPGFGGDEALAILDAAGLDAQIIVVSGEVGEEFAVTAMRGGAHDFVSKNRLHTLAAAAERGLREADERWRRKSRCGEDPG